LLEGSHLIHAGGTQSGEEKWQVTSTLVPNATHDYAGPDGVVGSASAHAALFWCNEAAQIEFWAKLGRAMEAVMTGDSVATVKQLARVERIDEVLALTRTERGRDRARAGRGRGPDRPAADFSGWAEGAGKSTFFDLYLKELGTKATSAAQLRSRAKGAVA
jgi:hypothetical protein